MNINFRKLVRMTNQSVTTSGRKKLLKAFVCFIILMVIFTIFSRAADSMTIPKVETGKSQQGTINRTISAAGKVEENQALAVSAAAGVKVKTVHVKSGEMINKDDVLFELDLEDLQIQISDMENEIEVADLQTSDKSYNAALSASKDGLTKQRALEDYNRAVASGNTAITQAYEAMIAAENNLNEYKNSQSNTSVDELYQDYEEKERLLTEALENQIQVKEAMQAAINEGIEDTSEHQSRIDSAGAAVAKAQSERDDALVAWKSSQDSDSKLTELTEAYNSKKQEYERAVADNKDNLIDKNRDIENASQSSEADSSETISRIERESKVRKLDELKQLYENNGIIKSDIDALISEVNIKVGDDTPDGASLVLADLSSGSIFTTQITSDEQKYLSREDLVTLEAADGTVLKDLPILSMQSNKEDPSMIDVSVLLADNQLELGSTATLKFTNKSQVYKNCIPRKALRGSAPEYYILVLKETDTVLGSQLAVEKVSVTVLDQYGDYAAISEGAVGADQELIISSNKQIEDGDRVRRQEE